MNPIHKFYSQDHQATLCNRCGEVIEDSYVAALYCRDCKEHFKSLSKTTKLVVTEGFEELPMVVPPEVCAAADYISNWAKKHTDRADWIIGPVCSRKYAERLKRLLDIV